MSNVSPCAVCPHFGSGFCDAVLGRSNETISDARTWQYHQLIPAGKRILTRDQASPHVFVLCGGWGLRFLQMANGRRQILSFLLPGDLFSVASIFEARVHYSVSALTVVQISGMKREEVQSRIAGNPVVVAALGRACEFEIQSLDELASVLGQYSAEERIAYLLLHLMKRVAARNVIHEQQYPFPLRQTHIADATGLTAVHVSRILSTFRDRGIVEFSNGILKVLNSSELQRLGSLY